MPWLTTPELWIALLTLTVLEIVLGIDNIVFLSIHHGKAAAGPAAAGAAHRPRARDAAAYRPARLARVDHSVDGAALHLCHQRLRSPPPDHQNAGVEFPLADRGLAHRRRLGHHLSKGYIYFALGFAVFVEMLNLRVRARREPVQLREAFKPE